MQTAEQILERYNIPITAATIGAFEALEELKLQKHDREEIHQANLILNSYLCAAQIYCTEISSENFSSEALLAFLTYPVWASNKGFPLQNTSSTTELYMTYLYSYMDPKSSAEAATLGLERKLCFALKKCLALGTCETYMQDNYEDNEPLAIYITQKLETLKQLGSATSFPEIDSYIVKRTTALLHDFAHQMGGQYYEQVAQRLAPPPPSIKPIN